MCVTEIRDYMHKETCICVYKERKETTHGEIGEIITTSYIYIYIREISTMFAIT